MLTLSSRLVPPLRAGWFQAHRYWWLGILLLALATIARGQDTAFSFDPSGNLLLVRGAGTPASPQILVQPQVQVVGPGEVASFFVVAADPRGLSYQWSFNGTNLNRATTDTLLLTNVTAANEGQYAVVLASSSGSVTSAPAMLWLDANGNGLPDSWELAYFGNMTNTATGDFDHDGVSNLQELFDGTNPTNTDSALFRLTLLKDGGTVVISPDQSAYTNGQAVTLSAKGDATGPFRAWTGDVVTRSSVISVTMTNNKSLYAHFAPLTFFWSASGSGDWSGATNWTPSLVPGSNDSVFIQSGATVTLNSDIHLTDLILGGSGVSPTLSVAGDLSVSGAMTWASGTMTGDGRTMIAPGATLTISFLNAISLTSRTLENGGTVFWTGSGTIPLNDAIVTNRPEGIFEVQNVGGFGAGTAPYRFDNAGIFRKMANSGQFTVGQYIPFTNYGTVEIQTGTLSLAGGGLNQGTISVAAGGWLDLALGTFNASADSSITGPGNFSVSGATANLDGLVNLAGTNTFSFGAANLTGAYFCTNNALNIYETDVSFNGNSVVSPLTLTLTGGPRGGSLGGTNDVTVLGQMNWTGGNMWGGGRTLIAPGATLTLHCVSQQLGPRTLENAGTILAVGAGVSGLGVNSALITNRAGAVFEVQNTGNFSAGGAPRFDNAGVFRKTVSAGQFTIGQYIPFNNYGTVDIQAGTLSVGGGGLNQGTISVPAGCALDLSGGTFVNYPASSITGAGNLSVSGATANLDGLVNLAGTNTFGAGTANLTGTYFCTNNTLNITGGDANFNGASVVSPLVLNQTAGYRGGGDLGGTNLVTVLGQMNWNSGNMWGGGRTVIAPGATLTLHAVSQALGPRTLENAGTTLVVGTGLSGLGLDAAVITNRDGAVFEVQCAGNFSSGSTPNRVENAGTFTKTTNSGQFTVGQYIPFNNYGTVDIEVGTLAAGGGYTCVSNSLLECALGGTTAGTGYGQLNVSGAVNLQGRLNATLANGFIPDTNETFAVVTAGTRNGTFSGFDYPSNAVTMELSNTTSAVFVLVTGVLPPAPVLLAPQILGTNLLLSWASVSNLVYRVQSSPDLNPAHWNVLSGDLTASSNTTTKLDPLASTNRFYRVLRVQ